MNKILCKRNYVNKRNRRTSCVLKHRKKCRICGGFFFKTPTFVGFGKDLPRRHSEGEPPLSETPFVKFHHSSRGQRRRRFPPRFRPPSRPARRPPARAHNIRMPPCPVQVIPCQARAPTAINAQTKRAAASMAPGRRPIPACPAAKKAAHCRGDHTQSRCNSEAYPLPHCAPDQQSCQQQMTCQIDPQ